MEYVNDTEILLLGVLIFILWLILLTITVLTRIWEQHESKNIISTEEEATIKEDKTIPEEPKT